MSLFIFQITIKQWDKGQNKLSHVSTRATMPSVFSVNAPPSFNVFNTPCILEQHGDDIATNVFSKGRIRASLVSADRIMFDRFQVVNGPAGPLLEFLNTEHSLAKSESLANGEQRVNQDKSLVLGPLNEHWIQARYTWRYPVLEANQIYWMYEEVTLNAMRAAVLDENCFLSTKPSIVFNDL
ncbi:MAG: hypothetical protein ACI9EX_000135 [Oleispira sp.]|jgi:hypothetical protein